MNTVVVGRREIVPSKIVCVGRNYAAHARELGNEVPGSPVFFLKPNSAISPVLNSVHQKEVLHYEGEICLVYGEDRFDAVGFGLDITKRKLQSELKSKGLPWERAKAFDGSALFGAFARTDQISDDLALELMINGKPVQSGHISHMLFKPDTLLNHLAGFMTLNRGDIVMTGTPEGVGEIHAGDLFYGRIMDGDRPIATAEWQAC